MAGRSNHVAGVAAGFLGAVTSAASSAPCLLSVRFSAYCRMGMDVDSTEPELVLGSLRGYRVWRLEDGGLRAITGRGEKDGLLRHDIVNRAACYNLMLHAAVDSSLLEIPAVSCACGFYAVYRAPALCYLYGCFGFVNCACCACASASRVYGSVQLSGRIIKGSTGVARAETLKPEALVLLPFTRVPLAVLQAAAELYQIPLVSSTELLREYPLEGRTARTDHDDLSVFEEAASWVL